MILLYLLKATELMFYCMHFAFMIFNPEIVNIWTCRYVGNLKQRTLRDQMAKDPTEVIRKAVLRMLPKNKLRDVSLCCSLIFILFLE